MQSNKLHTIFTINNNSIFIESNMVCSVTIKLLNNSGFIAKKITTTISEGENQLYLENLQTGNYFLNAFVGDAFLKCIRFKML